MPSDDPLRWLRRNVDLVAVGVIGIFLGVGSAAMRTVENPWRLRTLEPVMREARPELPEIRREAGEMRREAIRMREEFRSLGRELRNEARDILR